MATEANFEKGDEAEAKFMKVATALGWDVTPSTLEDDRSKHIDFVIVWGKPVNSDDPGAAYSVDVKARNTAKDGEEVWIEIRNTLGGPGYLYSEVDMIAFDVGDRFILVDRDILRVWIEENVAREYVKSARDAFMKVYTRVGKKDMITLVKTYHLKGLAMGEMKYG